MSASYSRHSFAAYYHIVSDGLGYIVTQQYSTGRRLGLIHRYGYCTFIQDLSDSHPGILIHSNELATHTYSAVPSRENVLCLCVCVCTQGTVQASSQPNLPTRYCLLPYLPGERTFLLSQSVVSFHAVGF
jgi:hypothetical protein